MSLIVLTAFNHLDISVPDLWKAKQFFIDVLGFRQLETSELRELGSQLRSFWPETESASFEILEHKNGLRIGIIQQDELPWETQPLNKDKVQFSLTFNVPNIQNAIDTLLQYPDIHIKSQSLKIGNRRVYFVTAWGMHVQLIEDDSLANQSDLMEYFP
jgi:catechol 2,3-dioxygenase-like lactoylglutathione lyase family enzyme